MANTIPLIRGRVLLSTATVAPSASGTRRRNEPIEHDAAGQSQAWTAGFGELRSRSLGPR